MATKDWVLLVLGVLGGVVAVRGVLLDYRRRAADKWREQQAIDRIDFVNDSKAAMGDEAAIAKRQQRDASHRLATGRGLDEDTPSLTRSEVFRAERGQPYWLTIGGVALSTVSSIVGALWTGEPPAP